VVQIAGVVARLLDNFEKEAASLHKPIDLGVLSRLH
jgi:hypothetical protein